MCRSWARNWGGQTRPWPPKAHKVVRDQASEQEVLRVGSAWVGNGVVGQRGKRLGKTPRDLKGKWRQSNGEVGERILPAKCTAFVQKLQVKRQQGGYEELEFRMVECQGKWGWRGRCGRRRSTVDPSSVDPGSTTCCKGRSFNLSLSLSFLVYKMGIKNNIYFIKL